MRFATSTWRGHWNTWLDVQALAPNLAGARNGIAKIRQRQADIARDSARLRDGAGRRPPGIGAGGGRSLEQTRRPGIAELQAALSEVARGLRRAESLAARARNLERTDPPAARDLYRQSLAIAADLPDALTGLKRTPPDPPTALGRPGLRRSHPTLLDAPCSRWPGLAHLRRRSQGGRSASASGGWHPDRRGQYLRIRRHARDARATPWATPS